MINIAESEWIIMKELWAKSPLTSRQIIDNIAGNTSWNDKTVHTLISRLCKKGAVIAKKRGSTSFYDYYANIDEAECVRDETRNFLKKMYSGSLKNMISSFVPDDSITKDDIKELRSLLDELEKGKKK